MSLNIAGPYIVTIGAYPDTDASIETDLIGGVILDVGIEIALDGGSSLDISIDTKGEAALAKNILTLTNATTDAWYRPREAVHAVSGGASIANEYTQGVAIYDKITISVTGGGENDQLKVWFLIL